MDLNNFISFNKGCYVGQELTHRSFHVGKVRKRVCRVISTESDFPSHLPVPDEIFDQNEALPVDCEGDNEVMVPKDHEWRLSGSIIAFDANVGLCLLSTQHSLNHYDSILQHVRGNVFFCGKKLLIKPPLSS
eukprot:GEMP01086424.1.p1 GENE.GEMP01086424.1~~GEMP01086424.1.p1  ORF type:complete len:132 (+),score=12.10 GEMP01086424.1:565-960(+)